MPLVANPRKATTDLIGELLAEFARPLPHGFVADDDAAGGEQLINHAETQREAEIQPYGMADNLGRKPIAGIAEASECRHPTRLPILVCRRKPVPQVDGAAPRHPIRCAMTGEIIAMKLPQTGGCLCGKSRYEITEAPQLVYTCHCIDCQRITSSAF